MTAPPAETTSERGLWVGIALGTPLMALAIIDALSDADDTHPAELARWIVAGALIVDLVVVPVALGVGRALRRSSWSRPLRWPLATSATVALVAWPFVRGDGRNATNPSLLPRDYGAGTAIVIVAVWLAAGLAAISRRRTPPPDT